MTDPTMNAPTRVCPHCQAQSQQAGPKCPHCGKKYKKRSTFVTVLIILVVLFVLGVGGCAVLIGGAATAVDDAIKEEEAKGITPAQYAAIKSGMTRKAVEGKLGKPSDAQEMEIDTSDFEGKGSTTSNDCIYYQKKGELASLYQFCFTDDKLSTKASY